LDYMDWEFVSKDLPDMMASMRMGADRIKEIVLSLRTFSRMDEAEYKFADIEAGIESTLTILNHRLKGGPKNPAIIVQRIFADLPKVECYAGQLNQVFMNIIGNAIDAIEELQNQSHQISEITIETAVLENDWIAISITNSGPAIPEAIRSRLFDPFFTTKEVGKGTGMGLAISYQIIVDRHKGNLRCESIADYGTRFVIEIPMQQISCSPRIGG
jgi:signal transduction histidine kinase